MHSSYSPVEVHGETQQYVSVQSKSWYSSMALSFMNPLFDLAVRGEKIEANDTTKLLSHDQWKSLFSSFQDKLHQEIKKKNESNSAPHSKMERTPSLYQILRKTLGIKGYVVASIFCFLYRLTLLFASFCPTLSGIFKVTGRLKVCGHSLCVCSFYRLWVHYYLRKQT